MANTNTQAAKTIERRIAELQSAIQAMRTNGTDRTAPGRFGILKEKLKDAHFQQGEEIHARTVERRANEDIARYERERLDAGEWL
jgi:hypothetical protein